MKALKCLFIGLIVLIVFTGIAMGYVLDASTIPASQHVAKVQEAVDTYDEVTLVGTFYFGDTGSVLITRDVTIKGVGVLDTKIKDGFDVFNIQALVHPTIENIWFDGAAWSAIGMNYCDGATIVNNKFTNIKARTLPPYTAFIQAHGIAATEAGYTNGIITGTYTIQGNEFDMGGLSNDYPGTSAATPLFAPVIFTIIYHSPGSYPHPTINIIDNLVTNAPEYAFKFAGAGSYSTVNVIGNEVHQAKIDYYRLGDEDPYDFPDGALTIEPYVFNTLTGSATIKQNKFLDIYTIGIQLIDQNDAVLSDNMIAGEGEYGIKLSGTSSGNYFDDINLANKKIGNMVVDEAHIYCGPDTENNTFKDISIKDTVIVDETDNPVTPEYDGANTFIDIPGYAE